MANGKNKYLAIFESFYDLFIIVAKINNIENINYKAAKVFLKVVNSGMKYYCNNNTDKDLEWLNEEIIKFIGSNDIYIILAAAKEGILYNLIMQN
jgi:hypothetical protein